jgi:hypothetical protein
LATLCNGYIEKVPVDPFSQVGECMIYKVSADCTGYLVYSVGLNGIDDGGDSGRVCCAPEDDIRRMKNYE